MKNLKPKTQIQVQKPSLYSIIILDDDITTMDFVCSILENIFNYSPDDAYELMFTIHNTGAVNAGIFTKDIAETKLVMANSEASIRDFPLKLRLVKQ